MNQEKYNLNWHTYSDHLREMLHEMMKSNELTDVTLVCDDKRQFKAHKIVLSACSSVFKSIINDLPQNSSVIYLRGIQHQEMESILEFMYLGIATFYQERLNEFLNVAKNLEIKVISKDVEFDEEGAKSEEPDDITSNVKYDEDAEPQRNSDEYRNIMSSKRIQLVDHSTIQGTSEGMFKCDQCESKFTRKDSLTLHRKSIHEGVKYACNQCDFEATQPVHLKIHIKSIHEGVKYACNQCDYQATQQSSLKTHIKSIHEGVKYACNQCDQQFKENSNLKKHIKSKHEGLRYSCNQCNHKATRQGSLRSHIKSKHC